MKSIKCLGILSLFFAIVLGNSNIFSMDQQLLDARQKHKQAYLQRKKVQERKDNELAKSIQKGEEVIGLINGLIGQLQRGDNFEQVSLKLEIIFEKVQVLVNLGVEDFFKIQKLMDDVVENINNYMEVNYRDNSDDECNMQIAHANLNRIRQLIGLLAIELDFGMAEIHDAEVAGYWRHEDMQVRAQQVQLEAYEEAARLLSVQLNGNGNHDDEQQVDEELARILQAQDGYEIERKEGKDDLDVDLDIDGDENSEEEKEKGECAICMDFPKDEVTTPCGHLFCRECLNGLFASVVEGSDPKCPICRGLLDNSIFSNQLRQDSDLQKAIEESLAIQRIAGVDSGDDDKFGSYCDYLVETGISQNLLSFEDYKTNILQQQ